ncbi:MAG: TasA family protein [Eubacteriales bacterium]|nr:TasA family protein [Eubacteriales bacterium]
MKSTKKSLLLSVLSLVLCFVMLIGTTFAWFTDSVTSGVNKIVAGNLDIELEYTTNGTNWTPVTSTTKLFDDAALWEPGHTEVAYLRLSNKGTLALKYNLAIKVANEVSGTNVAGETFKLSDYINMGVVEDWNGTVYADRAAARTAVTGAGVIANYSKTGNMAADAAAETLAVVVYMPEEVGNVANYKTGTTAPSIELGVSLVATQDTVESDSFDNQYDKNALIPTTVNDYTSISTLLGSVTASEPVAIKLSDDISVPNDAAKSAIKIPANADVTLDLNGHTISGGRSDKTPNYGMIDVGMGATLTVMNGTVTYGDDGDSGFSAYRDTITVQRGTLIVKNATIINTCSAGISSAIDIMSNTGSEDAKLIIENSTIESSRYGIRLFGNSETGSAILDMKNTTITATSSALFLHQPSATKKGLIDATVTDSIIKGVSGVYLWDCGNTAGNGDNIKLTLNGTTAFTSTGTYLDRDSAISQNKDGYFPGFNNQIIVDYSTAAGDNYFKVFDNRTHN